MKKVIFMLGLSASITDHRILHMHSAGLGCYMRNVENGY